jgi:hypothetical protein
VLFVGSSAHVASTGWLYSLGDVRSYTASRPLRLRWVPAALVLSAALAAALLSPAGFAWLLLPFFAWQFFHFAKQNLGLAALAASCAGVASLRPAERRALLAAGAAAIGALIARPTLLQLPVDPRLGAMFPVAALGFAAAVAAGVALLVRRPAAQRPAGFSVMYLMALLFPFPVFVFGSPYAAVGGMTAAHGMQYLLLVGMVAGGCATWPCSAAPPWKEPRTCIARHPRNDCCSAPTSVRSWRTSSSTRGCGGCGIRSPARSWPGTRPTSSPADLVQPWGLAGLTDALD